MLFGLWPVIMGYDLDVLVASGSCICFCFMLAVAVGNEVKTKRKEERGPKKGEENKLLQPVYCRSCRCHQPPAASCSCHCQDCHLLAPCPSSWTTGQPAPAPPPTQGALNGEKTPCYLPDRVGGGGWLRPRVVLIILCWIAVCEDVPFCLSDIAAVDTACDLDEAIVGKFCRPAILD
jgi:hypothetical protein